MALDAIAGRANVARNAWYNLGLSVAEREKREKKLGSEGARNLPPTTLPRCIRFGTCLYLEKNHAPGVCAPFAASGITHKDHTLGMQRVWWRCKTPGLCKTTWRLHTAPNHVSVDLWHTCGGSPAKGMRIGTIAGIGDVVNDETGLVQSQWLRPNPAARVPADESEKLFFVEANTGKKGQGEGPIMLRSSLVLSSERESVVNVELHALASAYFGTSGANGQRPMSGSDLVCIH